MLAALAETLSERSSLTRDMDRRWLALIALALLGVGVWWLRGSRETQRSDAATPSASELASTQRGENDALTVESVERAPVQLPTTRDSEVSATSTDATTVVEQEQLTKLFGAVRPDPSRAELYDTRIGVSAVDEWGERLVTHTSESGEYAFDGLRAGRYWISANAARDGEARARVDLAPGERERRLDLELALPPEVWVKVIDRQGAPPKVGFGLLAVATRERPGEWFDEVRGSFNNPFGVGQFWQNSFASETRGDEYLGRVILHSAPPVWISLLSFQRVIASQEVHAGQQEVVFELDDEALAATHGSLRARFVSAQTREPLAKAMVTLHNSGSHPTQLDADGRLEAPKLRPGWCAIRLFAGGFERSELRVRIAPGAVTDIGEVEVHPERTIRGVALDERDVGLKLRIFHFALDSTTLERSGEEAQYYTQSSGSGEFHIGQLSARLYELRFESSSSDRAQTTVLVDLREASVDDLRVVVPRGVPLVLTGDEQRWRAVRYELLDTQGKRVLASQLWSAAPQAVLVAPGAYSLLVRTTDSGEVQRRELVVGAEPVKLHLP